MAIPSIPTRRILTEQNLTDLIEKSSKNLQNAKIRYYAWYALSAAASVGMLYPICRNVTFLETCVEANTCEQTGVQEDWISNIYLYKVISIFSIFLKCYATVQEKSSRGDYVNLKYQFDNQTKILNALKKVKSDQESNTILYQTPSRNIRYLASFQTNLDIYPPLIPVLGVLGTGLNSVIFSKSLRKLVSQEIAQEVSELSSTRDKMFEESGIQMMFSSLLLLASLAIRLTSETVTRYPRVQSSLPRRPENFCSLQLLSAAGEGLQYLDPVTDGYEFQVPRPASPIESSTSQG